MSPPVDIFIEGRLDKQVGFLQQEHCEGNSDKELKPLHVWGEPKGGRYSTQANQSNVKVIDLGQEITIDPHTTIKGR